jgi:hypothetical protein
MMSPIAASVRGDALVRLSEELGRLDEDNALNQWLKSRRYLKRNWRHVLGRRHGSRRRAFLLTPHRRELRGKRGLPPLPRRIDADGRADGVHAKTHRLKRARRLSLFATARRDLGRNEIRFNSPHYYYSC